MNRKKKLLILLLPIVLVVLVIVIARAVDRTLQTVTYTITSPKISSPLRIALLTDLHSCAYGNGQRELLDAVDAQAPDLVLLGGDIIDDVLPQDNATTVLKALGNRYPTYYVSGNHEFWTDDIDGIKQTVRKAGIPVLEGDTITIPFNKQTIMLSGIDDPECGNEDFERQLQRVGSARQDSYHILLSHRPERINTYLNYPFDLVLSGHAHGGQWRIPGILNGLLAPNQGLFPKYAGGRYDFGTSSLIVSRGLARESTRIPRIFNRPELVIIELTPGK